MIHVETFYYYLYLQPMTMAQNCWTRHKEFYDCGQVYKKFHANYVISQECQRGLTDHLRDSNLSADQRSATVCLKVSRLNQSSPEPPCIALSFSVTVCFVLTKKICDSSSQIRFVPSLWIARLHLVFVVWMLVGTHHPFVAIFNCTLL